MAVKKTQQSKSDFIRSQPSTVSASDVVVKAKEAGIKFDASLVYKVRGRSTGKGKANKTTGAKRSAKAKTINSKADFVRAHANLSPKEVVEKGKAEGVKLNATYVYSVRGYDKTAAKKKRSPKAAARRATTSGNGASVARPITNASGVESLLKAVAAEIGLGRAMEILAAERARVQAVLGG